MKIEKRGNFHIFVLIVLLTFLPLKMEMRAKISSTSLYDEVIEKIADKYRLDPDLIRSIIKAESNFDRAAVSSKGAVGLMQLMPSTANMYGVKDLYDPQENIEGGAKYLQDLIKVYNGKVDLVLAAYNAGQEAIKKFGGIPPYPETRNYIEKIRASGFKKSIVRSRTKIYKYIDKSGRVVFTNDRLLYLLNTKSK